MSARPDNSAGPSFVLHMDGQARFYLLGVFLIALGFALYFMAPIAIPIVFAILLTLLLSPLVAVMARRGTPPGVTSAALILTIVGLLAGAISVLAEPADRWISEAPSTLREIERKLWTAKGRLADIQELAEDVDTLTEVAPSSSAAPVVLEKPSVLQRVLETAPTIVTMAAVTLFLSFFLLASGDRWKRRLIWLGRTWGDRRTIVRITNDIQTELSRYLATVTVINLMLGASVAGAMFLLGVPNPLLWGAMVAVFNYAPYLGALASTVVLTIVGLTTFPTLSEGALVPGVFLALTILEGQLITPAIVGQRLSLEPTIVFLSVLVWGWLWGVLGALMAVPIVTCIKVIAERAFPALSTTDQATDQAAAVIR